MFYNPTFNGKSKVLICDIETKQNRHLKEKKGSFSRSLLKRKQVNEVILFDSSGSGVLNSGGCSLKYNFSNNVVQIETFGLLHFLGPYSPVSNYSPLFFAEICAVIKCVDNDPDCGSVYYGVPGVFSSSLFESLVLTSEGSDFDEILYWSSDGSYNVIQPQRLNQDNSFLMKNSSITSFAIWKMNYYDD